MALLFLVLTLLVVIPYEAQAQKKVKKKLPPEVKEAKKKASEDRSAGRPQAKSTNGWFIVEDDLAAGQTTDDVWTVDADDKYVYYGSHDGNIYVHEKDAANGFPHVETLTPNSGQSVNSVDSDGERIFYATDGGEVGAYDRSDFSLEWSNSLGGDVMMVDVNDAYNDTYMVYTVDEDAVYMANQSNGSIDWSSADGQDTFLDSGTIGPQFVYSGNDSDAWVHDHDGNEIYTPNPADCCKETIVPGPNGYFYLGNEEGEIRVYDRSDGSLNTIIDMFDFGLGYAVSSLFVGPNGNHLYINDNDEAAVIDIQSGATLEASWPLDNGGIDQYDTDAVYADSEYFYFAGDNGTVKVATENEPPTASDDPYGVEAGQTLSVSDPANGVLANDSDPEGDPLSASLDSGPSNGTLQSFNGDGTFTYEPGDGSFTQDQFTYEASDGKGGTDGATVTITVNRPPSASNDQYTMEPRHRPKFKVKAPGVLQNDSDPNGDDLTARLVEGLSSPYGMDNLGELTFNSDGSFAYEPPQVLSGPVEFTYEASDPSGRTDQATVTIEQASGGPFDLIGILLSEPTGGTEAVGPSGVQLQWTAPARLSDALAESGAKSEGHLSVEIAHRGPEAKDYSTVETDVNAGKTVSSPEGAKSEGEWREYTARITDLSPGTHHFEVRVVGTSGKTLASKSVTAKVGLEDALRLEAPAPNPIRSSATVRFAVKDRTETKVTLYNLLGQKVRTLYQGTPPAGENQTLRLDASDLPSGTYVLRLETGNRSTTRQVTVVR